MSIVDSVLGVFSDIGAWISAEIPNYMALFYTEGNLTFLGVLAVAGLAFSVVFLLIGIIQRFLHFSG